jgi:hypothetical protein
MRYDDLDQETRKWMLLEFREEQAAGPYLSPSLSAEGRRRFPGLMEEAIVQGTEETLAASLEPGELWAEYEPVPGGGVRRTDRKRAARELARTEFNTWYVRGLSRRLMEQGEDLVQVYRADDAAVEEGDECAAYENRVFEVRFVYNGHRAKYWPRSNPAAFSVPSGPRCRHSVRRIPADMRAMLELERQHFGAAFRKSP